jgi:hypothetical protein
MITVTDVPEKNVKDAKNVKDEKFVTLFQNLPAELQHKIYQMHFKLQPKFLLDDLKNYIELKDELLTTYRQFYLEDDYSAFYWFRKDLFYYCNSYTRHEITPQIIAILKRQWKFDATQDIEMFFYRKLQLHAFETQISCFFALLLPDERTEFNEYVRKTFFSNFPFSGEIH